MELAHFLAGCEFKLAGADAPTRTFTGYGAVFGNVDSYGDVIEPGAFKAWLRDVSAGKASRPAMLLQHGGWGMGAEDLTPIGLWTDLGEDEKGLKVAGQLADTPRGREIHELMRMGAIDGLSIGYVPQESEPGKEAGGPRRHLKRVKVMEISPVTFPANELARVSSVKNAGRPGDIRQFEQALRERMGFDRLDAKRLAAGGWKAMRGDDELEDLEEIALLLRNNVARLRG